MTDDQTPTPHYIRTIATAAHCSPPTVRRYLDGLEVRPSIRERIERAIKMDDLETRWAAHKEAANG